MPVKHLTIGFLKLILSAEARRANLETKMRFVLMFASLQRGQVK